jgi:hypothetical protein
MKYDAPKEFGILSTILTSTGGKSTYKKLAAQWLNEVWFSASTFVVIISTFF